MTPRAAPVPCCPYCRESARDLFEEDVAARRWYCATCGRIVLVPAWVVPAPAPILPRAILGLALAALVLASAACVSHTPPVVQPPALRQVTVPVQGGGGDRRQQHPFDVFLYQTEPYRQGDAFTTDEGKGERAEEVATRVLGTHVHGAPDWFAGLAKRPTLIAYETVAYHFIRGQGDEAYAREVATFFRTLGYQGFGNGLPVK